MTAYEGLLLLEKDTKYYALARDLIILVHKMKDLLEDALPRIESNYLDDIDAEIEILLKTEFS